MNTEGLPNVTLSDGAGFIEGSREPSGTACCRDATSSLRLATGSDTEPRSASADPEAPVAIFHNEAYIRDALKRCSAPTCDAACAFRRTRDVAHLPAIIDGLIEHYAEPSSRSKLRGDSNNLRLVEDLGIDSLTMLEIVFLAEDVLQVSINDDELRPFRTVGDIKTFVVSKLAPASQ
jgi:acyl carrier protein